MKFLDFKPIESNPNLVSESVLSLCKTLNEQTKPLVAEIDPQFTGSKEFCEHYGVHPEDGANCIIVEVLKGG